MTIDTTRLPISSKKFSTLRSTGKIYVDKTQMIYKLAMSDAPVFLSRPRRFGKSLLVSTFESLFSRGLEDFKGLDIEKLWKENKTYQVMKFDFSRIDGNTANEFIKNLSDALKAKGKPFGFYSKGKSYRTVRNDFDNWLEGEPSGKYVLLIDEYDAPLTGFLNKPKEFEAALLALSDFYATIKGCGDAFRFVFITGIARFQKASIFSKMNTLDDITLNPNYGTITGYTMEELEKFFGPYIDNAANTLKMSRTELLERMEAQYDGFCFDEAARYRLYAPWSVLKFLSEPENGFKNYWSQTGGKPGVLLEYFADHAIKSPTEYDKQQSLLKTELTELSTIDSINPLALLTQAGYFTIDYGEGNTFFLRYPNGEVRETMAQLYTEVLYRQNAEKLRALSGVVKALSDGNAEELCNICNKAISNIPHGNDFPLKNEEAVRAFLALILTCQGILAIGEKANAHGRADIVAINDRDCVVIELKYCYDKTKESEENADTLLQEAVSQIKDRQYGEELMFMNVLRFALVYSEKNRKFVKWQKVE